MDSTIKSRIKTIKVLGLRKDNLAGLIARDREIALRDLMTESSFQPINNDVNDECGPYDVSLSIEENRLIFRIKNEQGNDLPMLVLSLKYFNSLLIIESVKDSVNNTSELCSNIA